VGITSNAHQIDAAVRAIPVRRSWTAKGIADWLTEQATTTLSPPVDKPIGHAGPAGFTRLGGAREGCEVERKGPDAEELGAARGA
jgi:hypothetical protein